MTQACVRAIATAVPHHRLPQAEARAFARGFFVEQFHDLERLLGAFDNTGIDARQLAAPLSWYEQPHAFGVKNELYREVALELSLDVAERAVAASGVEREAFGAIVFVSTSGISTPSIDGTLVQRIGLSRAVARVPLFGLGCAGGVAGLARAADLVRALERPVLLVAAEVCSATFMHGDRSKSNLVATALFGDGAAAIVLAPEGDGLEILGGHSRLLDDTEHVMGWTVQDEGLQVRFARSIPGIVREVVPGFVRAMAERYGVAASQLVHFVVHPGGAKVLHAYADALALPRERLSLAWEVLRDHGNMSSATVLFVLERFLASEPQRGEHGAVLGLGPGFCAEGVVVRW